MYVNTLCMNLWNPTHSQYIHQRVVATFRDLIPYYKEQGFTHISCILLYLAVIEGVRYEVQKYITTGALPYDEWSEERPCTDEAEW